MTPFEQRLTANMAGMRKALARRTSSIGASLEQVAAMVSRAHASGAGIRRVVFEFPPPDAAHPKPVLTIEGYTPPDAAEHWHPAEDGHI